MFGLGLTRLRQWGTGLVPAAGQPIAIDFGASGVKALQLGGGLDGGPPSLVAAAFLPTPEDLLNDPPKRLTYQLQMLPSLIKGAGFKGKRAIVAMPSSQTHCKHVQVPLGDGTNMGDVVRYELAGQLGCAPESLLCRHIEVGTTPLSGGGKIEVVALAASRGVVGKLMEAVRSCKLEPVGMHPECVAMLRGFEHLTRGADVEQATLYLDMGLSATRVIIAHGPNLVFAKTVGLGGYYFDAFVMRQRKCERTSARVQRLALATLAPLAQPAAVQGAVATVDADEDGPKIDLSEPLAALTDEISMCLRYHESLFAGKHVTKTIFVGGEARHTPLCLQVARAFRLPAHVADPIAVIARTGNEPCKGVKFNEPQPGWAVVAGLCRCPTDL